MAGAYSEYGINRYINETKRLFDVLESRLKDHDWLAGDKYTLADIASYSWVRAASIIDVDISKWPGIDKWVKKISERPAVQKARNVPPSTRTDADMAEMFKNMRAKVDAMKNTEKHDS
jgi:glutathione S-transferase